MIATLKTSKAQLSRLVNRAAQGEEVIITVRGQPKARLCPLLPASSADRQGWARELRMARKRWSVGIRNSSAVIMDEVRGDRL